MNTNTRTVTPLPALPNWDRSPAGKSFQIWREDDNRWVTVTQAYWDRFQGDKREVSK